MLPAFLFVSTVLMSPEVISGTQAETVRVEFDVNSMVGCRDVTPREFAETNPDERLVEAKFQVSTLIRSGSENDLIQYLYRIDSPERSLKIVDYLPKTTLATNIVGDLGIETKLEKTSSIGITAAGHYDHIVNGEATAAKSSKATSSVRYKLLPRLDLLAASGTTARGTGVYYKLKPSDRGSLEGAKDFAIVLRVPRTWRGDYVRVVCQATRHQRAVVLSRDGTTPCGTAGFVVALYMEQDREAKVVAARLVRADQQLLHVAAAHRREIDRRKYPTLGHEIGATLSLVDPKIPPTWLNDVYQAPAWVHAKGFEKHLPAPVREAATEYRMAKRTLHELCGEDGATNFVRGSVQ